MPSYWITSSAVANSVSGMTRPRALAVFALITNSNLVGKHDRQVGWFLALDNAAGIMADVAKCTGLIRPIGHQPTELGENRLFAAQ
jgi:hypothetical protein